LRGLGSSLQGFANLALASGRPLRAACMYGAAQRLRPDIGLHRLRDDAHVQAARAACADDMAFEAAWREGGAMTLEQAIAFAEQADAD
jgi:hypothetical protein